MGADNFLGEIGGVANCSRLGAEVSVEREKWQVSLRMSLVQGGGSYSPDPMELAVGEGEMVGKGLLSAEGRGGETRHQHTVKAGQVVQVQCLTVFIMVS